MDFSKIVEKVKDGIPVAVHQWLRTSLCPLMRVVRVMSMWCELNAGSYKELHTFIGRHTTLLPKRPSNPNTAYIVSAFMTSGNLDSLDKTWSYWSGADFIVENMPASLKLERITFHKVVVAGSAAASQDDERQGCFSYVLLCELGEAMADLNRAREFIDHLKFRQCGISSLYVIDHFFWENEWSTTVWLFSCSAFSTSTIITQFFHQSLKKFWHALYPVLVRHRISNTEACVRRQLKRDGHISAYKLKLEKYVGPMPTHCAAVRIEQRNPNPNLDRWPFEPKMGTPVTLAYRERSRQFWFFYFFLFLSWETVRKGTTVLRLIGTAAQ